MIRSSVEWFVEALRERGVEWIAALCGHGLDPLFDAATRAGLRLIDTRNEQTAGYIAECYGRLTRKPGVCASSSGVAVANALTGVMNAWFDQAPMLYISGAANLSTLGMGAFQDCDQVSLVRPVTKYSRLIGVPERSVQMLDEAWHTALHSPRGPVHLMYPMDIQRTPVEEHDLVRTTSFPPVFSAEPAAIELAARMLTSCSRPLILASSEVFYRGEGEELLNFASLFSIPVQTPIWDRGICDSDCDSFLGVIGALTSDPGLLAHSDCIVLAATPADYRLQYLQQHRTIVRLHSGWLALGAALAHSGRAAFTSWLDEARLLRTDFSRSIRAFAADQRQPGRTHAVDIIDALSTLPHETALVIDGGSIGQWAHHLLTERRYPGHWLTCGRGGVVGYGLAGAMAARLAFPAKPVVLLSGDGAFTFTVAEIECASRQNLPFVVIVADDQCWGITHSGHLRQYGCGMATQLGAINFSQLAGSLGARGIRVDESSKLSPTLQYALELPGITVIHVPISGGNPAQT